MMFRQLGLLAVCFVFSFSQAFAADPLHNTRWQTFDEDSGKPKSVIKITEKNGLLFGTIVKILAKGNANACDKCKGKYAGKPLIGATIIRNLKPKGKGKYTGGTIDDPQNGKTYKLKATLDGKRLKVRGFVGVSLLGRTQTWKQLP